MSRPFTALALTLAGPALGCATSPPASAAASVEAPLVASVEPAPDGRPQMIGRPWLRQRATLSLAGADARLVIDSESGVANVNCPEELRGTSTEGCASPEAARALEQRVDRGSESLRGSATTERERVRVELRAAQGAEPLRLSCRWVDATLRCDEVTGWPVREGFTAPTTVTFARGPR